jgi:thymidylate synthase ThyX
MNSFSLRLAEDGHFEIRDVAKSIFHHIRLADLAFLFDDLESIP